MDFFDFIIADRKNIRLPGEEIILNLNTYI